MSTASRVALASATAGVLAATAAGLAATPRGRAFTRKAKRTLQPMINQRVSTVVDAVEASLEEHGVLHLLPDRVREALHTRLEKLAGRGSRSGGTGATSSTARNGARRATRSRSARSSSRRTGTTAVTAPASRPRSERTTPAL